MDAGLGSVRPSPEIGVGAWDGSESHLVKRGSWRKRQSPRFVSSMCIFVCNELILISGNDRSAA